ncbi:MAG: SDR family oxidoreductase [Oscillospiraceae bacterium]|nr:SDR family oxidoreductase [Oscillospiraceae bacterium]
MNFDYVKNVFGLDGKKAVVTGGNSGIGLGIARSLAHFGADVVIVGRDPATLEQAKEELCAIRPGCGAAYQADVSDKAQADAFFAHYRREYGEELDILVANAGVTYAMRALESEEQYMDRIIGINYKGALFFCQGAAEFMKARRSGNIVIVTSVNALWPLPPHAVYTSTKAAQEVLMQCLAVDLAQYGVRVNTLAPGEIITKLGRQDLRQIQLTPEAERDRSRPRLPLGRAGEPEDMGDVVACMVSDAFRYMTGSTVLVDGGLKLRNV